MRYILYWQSKLKYITCLWYAINNISDYLFLDIAIFFMSFGQKLSSNIFDRPSRIQL